MSIQISIPHLSYNQISDISYSFLCEMGCKSEIPVPIEKIIDNKLRLNVVPIPGLKRAYNVDGFALRDLRTIEVDQFIHDRYKNRIRYTLAHELGHILLQKDIMKQYEIKSIDEWIKIYEGLDDEEHSWLEWQSYAFGGLVLVPRKHLKIKFEECLSNHKQKIQDAINKGFSRDQYKDYFLDMLVDEIGSIFDVSKDVIVKRVNKDKLESLIK